MDERVVKSTFDFELLRKELYEVDLFTEEELAQLTTLQDEYTRNINSLDATTYSKEIRTLSHRSQLEIFANRR